MDNISLLQFTPAVIGKRYRKKWNIHENDFVYLTRNGKPISNTLYRIGGMGHPKLNSDKYFMLLKYSEALYPQNILKMSDTKDPKHLEHRWCIFDINGNEKIEFNHFSLPYLVDNSCIYHINNKYYNIESGELYCEPHSSMKSSSFLFLDNKYDEDVSKRGVMKINLSDGKYELFK